MLTCQQDECEVFFAICMINEHGIVLYSALKSVVRLLRLLPKCSCSGGQLDT